MKNIRFAYINNKKIHSFKSKEEILNSVVKKNTILISMNAEAIMSNDKEFEQIINNNVAFADGIGAVMALKDKGLDAVKIPGVELWLEIIKRNLEKKTYLIGSTSEVIEKTTKKLYGHFNGINIVGYHDGYFDETEYLKLEKDILDKDAEIIFIAIGQPKQELIANRLSQKHEAFYMCVGGSFDIYSGVKKRAPKLLLDLHLEWFYRLLKEPTRFGRQVVLVKFLFLLKSGKI